MGYSVVRMIDELEHKKRNDEDCSNNYFNVVGIQEISSTFRRGRKTVPKMASSQPLNVKSNLHKCPIQQSELKSH
jgi:hypothetical protein